MYDADLRIKCLVWTEIDNNRENNFDYLPENSVAL